jgi:hypothetical protein
MHNSRRVPEPVPRMIPLTDASGSSRARDGHHGLPKVVEKKKSTTVGPRFAHMRPSAPKVTGYGRPARPDGKA